MVYGNMTEISKKIFVSENNKSMWKDVNMLLGEMVTVTCDSSPWETQYAAQF